MTETRLSERRPERRRPRPRPPIKPKKPGGSLPVILAAVAGAAIAVSLTIYLYTRVPAPELLARGLTVVDQVRNIEWMRCSVGQRWNGVGCTGSIITLDHEQVAQAVSIAERQLGRGWRLPSKEELQSLVCRDCGPPMIDPVFFPNTGRHPYWTGQQVAMSPRNYWSVNFLTGHSYTGFFENQELAVRLVREIY